MLNDSSLLEVGRRPYLSSLRVSDAGVTEVTTLPFRVEAVSLELPELKGGMKGTSLHFDGDGVDPDRHPLNHLLCKAILTENRDCQHKQIRCAPLKTSEDVCRSTVPLACCNSYRRGPIRGTRLLACPHFHFNLI